MSTDDKIPTAFYKNETDDAIYYGHKFVSQIELPEGYFSDEEIQNFFYYEFTNQILSKIDELKFERKGNIYKAKFEFRFYNEV